MGDRRVVITGAGWVTPLGHGPDEVWSRLLAGESAIGPIVGYDAQTQATNFAAEVTDFSLADVMGEAAAPYADSSAGIQFALGAAASAMRAAKLGEAGKGLADGVDARRFGAYFGAGEGRVDLANLAGTCLAGWTGDEVDGPAWAREAFARLTAKREIEQEPHVVLSYVSHAFGLRGPAFNCMTACAASTQAVGEAFEMIRRGDADLMLAGGSHSMIHPLGMTGFIRLTAMSTRRDDPASASRPFDSTRDGFVMGEGAGVVVLEELEHAKARGAHILGEVAGFDRRRTRSGLLTFNRTGPAVRGRSTGHWRRRGLIHKCATARGGRRCNISVRTGREPRKMTGSNRERCAAFLVILRPRFRSVRSRA
jgi:3-oxoacyl-[acyl-carrier-protein] synthase II